MKNYDELNAWLLDQCVAYAQAHRHPERREQTIWQMFEAERPSLVPYAGMTATRAPDKIFSRMSQRPASYLTGLDPAFCYNATVITHAAGS